MSDALTRATEALRERREELAGEVAAIDGALQVIERLGSDGPSAPTPRKRAGGGVPKAAPKVARKPRPRAVEPRAKAVGRACRVCGETGHYAKSCPLAVEVAAKPEADEPARKPAAPKKTKHDKAREGLIAKLAARYECRECGDELGGTKLGQHLYDKHGKVVAASDAEKFFEEVV